MFAGAQGVSATPTAPAPAANGAFPRNETLYTSGTQWGPPANWNPIREWDSATGTKGLVYETLFLYDPQTGKFTPWLAESGSWTGDKTYELKLRRGSPGPTASRSPPTDVVFTVELGKMETVPYANLWTWLEKAEAVDDHDRRGSPSPRPTTSSGPTGSTATRSSPSTSGRDAPRRR